MEKVASTKEAAARILNMIRSNKKYINQIIWIFLNYTLPCTSPFFPHDLQLNETIDPSGYSFSYLLQFILKYSLENVLKQPIKSYKCVIKQLVNMIFRMMLFEMSIYIIITRVHKMVSIANTLINIYLVTTFTLFGYIIYTKLNNSDNYFAAILQMIDNRLIKLLLYSVAISVAAVIYKITIALFYEQVKENQTLNLIEKIGYKIFQLFYLLFTFSATFGFETFISITAVFIMFVFHHIAIARANFLIHTHSSENMGMNYRLLAHFLIMLFIDYEMVSHTFFWLFSEEQHSSYILFAYYSITISMTILQPAVSFFIHFYQVYTNCMIENSDINLVRMKLFINIPRLIIQLFLSVLIAIRSKFSFLIIFSLIQSINQISNTVRNFSSMKSLIDRMENLKQIGPAELEKQHDRVCTVCLAEIANSALLLPCKHIFHKECLRQWIIKNSNHHCPKCKKSFDFDNMRTSKLQEQIRKVQEGIRERNAQEERVDPLGFAKDQRNMGKKQHRKMRQQSEHHMREEDEQNIEVVKIGDNHLAKLQQTKKRKTKVRKPEHNIGSVPFGLPTEAIYCRNYRDIEARDKIIFVNEKMIKFMKMDPAKQLLFVPEF